VWAPDGEGVLKTRIATQTLFIRRHSVRTVPRIVTADGRLSFIEPFGSAAIEDGGEKGDAKTGSGFHDQGMGGDASVNQVVQPQKGPGSSAR